MKTQRMKLNCAATLVVGAMMTLTVGGLAMAGTGAVTSAPAAAPGSHSHSMSHGTSQGVDAMIEHLHNQLKITAAQEPLWQKLAAVMRANSARMISLAKARNDHTATQSAVEDLNSYAEIAQAHAEGMKNLVPPFQALYDSMSADQKKAADDEFREHYRGHKRPGK